MDNNVKLDVIPKDAEKIFEALSEGKMVIARSKNEFLYVTDEGSEYQFFMHTPGSAEGGRRSFPKNEKYAAIVKNLVTLADALFSAEYDKSMHMGGVLACAEEGILSMFPMQGEDGGEDIEFIIPGGENHGGQ
jgi:hypothetical protein